MRFKWTSETYSRRSVAEIEKFVGWDFLKRLVANCRHGENLKRDRALICALFETGGRSSEVLQLTPEMFVRKEVPVNTVVVRGMPVSKRYKKVGDVFNPEDRRKMITKPVKAFRSFPIRTDEPLCPPLLEFIETRDDREDKLFNIGRRRVYQIVTRIDPRVWPHWFRSQRASQLAWDYSFDAQKLTEFFNWNDLKTAFKYSHFGYKKLAESMQTDDVSFTG